MTWMQWIGLAVLAVRAILAAAGRHRASPGRGESGGPEAEQGQGARDGRGSGR